MPENASRVLVALSGGVDSSYALLLAVGRFCKVRAAYVDTSGEGVPDEAAKVADHLGVDLLHVDASRRFRRDVISWAEGMLSRGLTPNPCARCNSRIKLAVLYEILKPGEILVTGHYAVKDGDLVRRGACRDKDQSYFLSMVDREIIARCTFPVGIMKKQQVRTEALDENLPFRQEESMDLCFSMSRIDGSPGNILDTSGGVIGTHRGLGNFTVGQRKGFGGFGKRMYVVSVDPAENTVVIGERRDLLSSGCSLGRMNWFTHPVSSSFEALVQTRYRREVVEAGIQIRGDSVDVHFKRSEEAVAPGQVCAVYLDQTVIGGGIIISTQRLERVNT